MIYSPFFVRKAEISDILASALNLTSANGIFGSRSGAGDLEIAALAAGRTSDCTMTRASNAAAAAQATPPGTAVKRAHNCDSHDVPLVSAPTRPRRPEPAETGQRIGRRADCLVGGDRAGNSASTSPNASISPGSEGKPLPRPLQDPNPTACRSGRTAAMFPSRRGATCFHRALMATPCRKPAALRVSPSFLRA